MDQKRLVICLWYSLNKNPEKKVVYGNNLQGYLQGMTKYQPPFGKVCPFKLQALNKQKKEVRPRKKMHQTRYTKSDLSDESPRRQMAKKTQKVIGHHLQYNFYNVVYAIS